MSIAPRLPIVVAVMALAAACTSVQQADSPVQRPGEPSARNGLEVPPDAWERPAAQTANAGPQR